MASTPVLLLQLLLLVSPVFASHHFGGTSSFSFKEKKHDGSLLVEFRTRSTFDFRCNTYSWNCHSGDCGTVVQSQSGEVDSSMNTPISNRQWCEQETVEKRMVKDDKPFELRERSCCWIPKRFGSTFWALSTLIDLGTRSDTGIPNRSPDIAILPFLRIPENCPRSYRLMSFDPDGDAVRCRYGVASKGECGACNSPAGFVLDEATCTLHYLRASANPRVFGFELAVEDFPRKYITLSYSHGVTVKRHSSDAIFGSNATSSVFQSSLANFSTLASTTRAVPTIGSTTITPPVPTPTPVGTQTASGPGGSRRRRSVSHIVTDPLSKLPLQFSFLVDPPIPSCQPGVVLPKLVYPTPQDGERIQAEVDKVVEIRVKAEVKHGWVHDIIISGPLNITKHRTTQNEFVIRWTPTKHNLWNHFPVCFVVESETRPGHGHGPGHTHGPGHSPTPSHGHGHGHGHSTTYQTASTTTHNHKSKFSFRPGVYQSEMRCVLIDVREDTITTNVVCTEYDMRVEVQKKSFAGRHSKNLQLNDHNNVLCSLKKNSNKTHIIAIIPLNSCGTVVEEDDHYLYFRNSISAYDDINDVITRKHQLEVHFYCQYSKKGNVSLSYVAHRKEVTVWDRGMGTFTYQFEFFPDKKFDQRINPKKYPLLYKLGNRIYMQIQATSKLLNTELFVKSCTAAPFDNPNYTPTYTIIKDGCAVDPSLVFHPSPNNRTVRLSLSAFKFIGMFPQVYITCSVLMCEIGNPSSRCAQGCIPHPINHKSHHKVKRDVAIQTESNFISQGPLQLAPSLEDSRSAVNLSPNPGLSMNVVFVGGCLLAAVFTISGLIVYKTRQSPFTYNPLPIRES